MAAPLHVSLYEDCSFLRPPFVSVDRKGSTFASGDERAVALMGVAGLVVLRLWGGGT